MPAWRDFPLDDLAAIAAAVRSLHSAQGEAALHSRSRASMGITARNATERMARATDLRDVSSPSRRRISGRNA